VNAYAELDVPLLFVWKSPDGSDLMVMYQHDYGSVAVLPGGRTAVSVSFTSDNQGPHTPKQIARIYGQLRKRFPKARVQGSDLNALTAEARLLRPQLPVVTQEIGDTWIYGTGRDPLMIARLGPNGSGQVSRQECFVLDDAETALARAARGRTSHPRRLGGAGRRRVGLPSRN
jgi:hypothetical protein